MAKRRMDQPARRPRGPKKTELNSFDSGREREEVSDASGGGGVGPVCAPSRRLTDSGPMVSSKCVLRFRYGDSTRNPAANAPGNRDGDSVAWSSGMRRMFALACGYRL